MAALSSTETAATMTRAGSSTFIYGPTAKDINETSEGRGRKIDISAGKCLKELESTWRTLAGAPIRGCAAPAGEKLGDISALLEACAGVTLPNSSNTIADVLSGSVTLVTWLNEQARDLHYPVMQNTAKGESVEAKLPYGGTEMAFEPGGDASDPENLYDVSKYNSNARVYGAGAPPAPQDTAYEDALRIALSKVPGSGMQFKRLRDPPTGWMLGKCNNEDGRYSPTTSGNAMPGFGDPDAFAKSAEWEEHFTPEYDEDGDEVAADVYGLKAFQKTEMSTEASQYYCRLLGIPFSFDDTLEGDAVRNNMRVMVRHWINFLRTAIKVYDDIDRYLYQRVTTRYPQLVKQGGGVPSYSSRPRGPFGNKVLPYIAYRVDVAVPTEPIGEVKDGSRRPNPEKMGETAMAPLSAKMATRVAYGDVVPSAAVHAFQVLLQKCFASPKTVQAAVVRGLDRAKPYGYNGGFTEALGSFREVIGYCSMLSRMPAAPAAAAPLLTYTEEVLMLLKTFGTPPTMGGGQNAGGQKKAWAVSALLDEAKEKINAGDAPQRADMEALYGQLDALGAGADGSGQKDEEEVMFDFNKRSGGPAVAVNQVTWADGAEPTPFENPNYMQPPSSGGGKKGGDREKVRDRASSVRSGGPPLGVIGNVVGEAFHPSSFNPKLREMARATQRRRDMAVPLSRGTGRPGGPRLPSYGGGRGGPPPRSGDWRCPRCDVNNFGYRKVCFKCGTSAPPKGAAGARAPALQLQANKVGWEASGGSWLDAFEEDDGMWGGGVGCRSDDVGGGSSWGVQNDDRGYSNHEVAPGARKKAEELAHLRAQFEACASRLAEVDDYEWSALAAADDAGAAGESLGVAAMHVGEEPEHVAYLRNELRPIMGEVDLDCESGPTPMVRSRYYGAEWVPVDEVLAAEHEISIRSVHVPPPPPTAESGTASEVFDFAGEDEQEPSSLSFRVVDFPGFTRTVTFERYDEDDGWADYAAGGGWGDGIDEADTRGVLSSTASLAAAAAPAGPSPVSPLSLRPSQTHSTGASIIDPDAEKVEEGGGGEDGGVGGRAVGPSLHAVSWGELDAGVGLSRGRPYNRSFDPGVAHDCSGGLQAICVNAVRMRQGRPPPSAGGGPGGQRKASVAKTAQVDGGAGASVVGGEYLSLLHAVASCSLPLTVAGGAAHTVTAKGLLVAVTRQRVSIVQPVYVVPAWTDCLLGQDAFAKRVEDNTGDEPSYGVARYSVPPNAKVNFTVVGANRGGSGVGVKMMLPLMVLAPGSPQAAVLMAVSAARRVYGSAGALRAVSGLVVRPVRVGSGAVNGVRGLESHVVKQTLQEFHENNLHKDPRTLLAEYDARRHPGVLLTTRTMPPCVPCALVNIRERATNARSDGLPYHSVGVAPPGSIAIVDQMGPFTTAAARGTDGKFKVSIVPGVASLATQANLIVCGSTNDPSVQLMQSTAEVGQKLIEYCEEGKAMGQPVRVIIADAATVHKSTKLQGHCKANQIELVVLTKGMHEAVGQAEALVRTSKLAMKAIMLAKRCHVTEWELAIRAVVMRKRVMYTRGAAVVPFVKRFGGSLHIDRHYAAEPMGLVVVLREQDKGTPGNLDVKSMLARFIGYDQRRLCFLVFVYKTAKLEYVKTIKAFKGGQAELALSGRYAHSADMGPLASGVAYFEELGEAVKAGAAVSAGGPVPTAAMVGPVAPKIVVPRTLPTAFDKAKTAVAAARGGAMEVMRPAEHRLDAAARAASGSAASVVSAPPPPPNVDLGAPGGGGLARYRAEVAETEENFRKLQEHWSQAAKLATEERAGAVATAAQEMIRSEAAEASAAAAERAAAEAALQKTQQALKACDPLLAGGAAAEATAQPPGRAAAEVDGEAPAAPRPAQGAEDVVPPYDDYVGRQVRKKFDGYGTFLGTVESVKGAVRPYFTVRYDDGDEEQVTKGELKLILVPLGVASATVPMVANGPPVKRQVGWVLPGSGMSSGDATTDASRRAGEAAMEETSVRRGRMRAGEWRKWWNPSDKSPMVELVERNAPVAYRDGGGAECEKRNGRGGAHQLEYDKYKSAKTLQEAVRLGAGPYLAADAAAKRMVVVVGDGSGVPLVDDYSDVGGPRVLNEEEDLAEAAGVGVARVGEPVLDVAAVRPAAPAGVAALPAAPGGAGAMPSRAAAEMAEAGFRPYEALAPTSFGRVVSPHKGEVSRRSWVPKNWNDRERDGEVNADQEVWDVADVDEAVMFRKMGAVRTASVTEAEAEGAFKSTYMVHREKQLKSTGTGADYKVSTKYKTRFCARGDRDKFQIDYWAKSANTLRVEDMQLFFAQAMSGEDGQLTSLDFSSAHLQAPIDPDVKKTYVDIPPCDPDYGKVGEDGKPMVWLVIGGFYGKVPMPRMWEQWLAQYLRSRGAVRLSHSKCIWTWTSATGSGERMMAMIHADDKMIWTTDTVGGRAERDLFIAAGFAVKETGGYDENGRLQALFVGFDVVHQKGGCGGVPPGEGYIHVCAETQIDALVTAFGFAEANTSEVPYPAGYQLSLDPDETKDDSEFARCAPVLVGSLLYIKNVRPDIDAQRHNMQRKTAMGFNPKDTAMGKAVLRYLHGSRRRGLRWGGKMAATMRNKLYLYADSSYKPEWGNCSALCVIPMLNGGPVGAWVAKAPNWVDSPNAGEMCALHQACRKAVTLRHALGEYGLYQPGPSVVLEDNAAAIGQAAANGGLKNARHLQGCVNLVTEMQEGGKVVVKKVDGERNPADLGTKPVQKAGLHKVLREMIMYDG